MQKTYEEIKVLSEDASLTQLMQCFLLLVTGNLKDIITLLNDIMQKYDKSIKLFNFIGIAMLARGQTDKALKMYEKIVNDLDLKSPEKCKKYIGNADIEDLVHNYFIAINWTTDEPSQIAAAQKILDNFGGHDQSALITDFEEKFAAASKKVFEEK